jgi:hypothetical protein
MGKGGLAWFSTVGFPYSFCDFCGRENPNHRNTSGSQAKIQLTPTPDYMHRDASTASVVFK